MNTDRRGLLTGLAAFFAWMCTGTRPSTAIACATPLNPMIRIPALPTRPGRYVRQLLVDETGPHEEWVELVTTPVISDVRFDGETESGVIEFTQCHAQLCAGGRVEVKTIAVDTCPDCFLGPDHLIS